MTASNPPLIHIGFPKTASTWLQESLFQPECGFHQALSRVEIQGGIIAPTPFMYVPVFMRERYERNLQGRGNMVPVVSSEVLSGNIYCGGYNAKQNADRLHETFPGAKVLIVTREQKSLIRALFHTLVKWGMPHSIERLLSPLEPHRFPQFDFDYLRFDLSANYYRKLFGEQNVLVLPYELFVSDPRRFLRDIVTFADLPIEFHSIVGRLGTKRRLNRNRTISAITFQRWFNYFFISNALNYSGMFASKFNEGIYRIRGRLEFLRLPGSIDAIMERRVQGYIRQKTAGEFAESNRRLQSICKHDLRALGYEL